MRVCGFGADNPASADYRCFSWLRGLERRGHTVWRGDLSRIDQVEEKVKDAEVVIIGRQNDAQFFAALLMFRDQYGYRLVVDTDDYSDGLPEGHANHPAWVEGSTLRKLARAQYKYADLVTVSTPFLERQYRGCSPEIAVVPNCVDPARFERVQKVQKEERHRGDVRIYWAGGMSHYGDLALLRPAYERLLKERPNVKFIFAAFVPDWAMAFPWDRVFFVPFCDLDKYPQQAAWLCADIAVAPLEDHPFNRAKSHVKWLEYGMNGIAGVYQDMEPYAAVRDGETGLKTSDGWYEPLVRLVDNPDLRAGIADRAKRDILANWNVEKHLDAYERLLARVAEKPLAASILEGPSCLAPIS